MSGQGQYTTYVPPNTSRSALLAKLFPGDRSQWSVTPGTPGGAPPFSRGDGTFMSQPEAAAAVAQEGNLLLLAKGSGGMQKGDPDIFPKGVSMSFSIDPDGFSPDTASVTWKRPGDPANAYTPDITGLAPGQTSGLDKSVNPNLSVNDIVPNYQTTDDTNNPASTGQEIYAGLTLGKAMKSGASF